MEASSYRVSPNGGSSRAVISLGRCSCSIVETTCVWRCTYEYLELHKKPLNALGPSAPSDILGPIIIFLLSSFVVGTMNDGRWTNRVDGFVHHAFAPTLLIPKMGIGPLKAWRRPANPTSQSRLSTTLPAPHARPRGEPVILGRGW